jgi:hypothetical protein
MIVIVKVRKQSYTSPIGSVVLDLPDQELATVTEALAALETVQVANWDYTVLQRLPEQLLVVVENYPNGEMVLGGHQ